MVSLESEHKRYLEYEDEERTLSLMDITNTIVRYLWFIVIVVVVLTGMAVGFSLAQTPEYSASVKILVSPKQGQGDVGTLSDDVTGLQELIQTLTEAGVSRPTADAVIQRLNLKITPDDLLKHLEAQQIPETQYIQVSYEDSSPQRAQLIANTSGEVLSDMTSDGRLGSDAVTARVFEPATRPTHPVSPNTKLNVAMALAVGTVLGIASAFVLDSLGLGTDPRRRDIEANQSLGPRPVRR
jgi:capsular polysaccharide biosynthesis protein